MPLTAVAVFRILICALAVFSISAGTAFTGLAGLNWDSDENYVRVNGKTQILNQSQFCTRLTGKVECKITKPARPDYFLIECDRNRRICDGAMAVILPNGEPWLTKIEYQITKWTTERVSAVPSSVHRCLVTALQIDLGSKEVIFTETYTKALENDPICIPENIGHTTTYKLENY